MLPTWTEISKLVKKRRKSLGLTQGALARGAGVSQSLIAKLESERTKASYDRVKAIFDYLNTIERGREHKAKEVQRSVVSLEKDRRIREAVEIMLKRGFSQIPVRDGDSWIGIITETSILERLEETSKEDLYEEPVSEVLNKPFPMVDEDTPLSAIRPLLEYNQAVLTTRKGIVVGVITKSDLL
jgi:predicted transcriptional regulator